jgi:hypothetical protein
MVREVPQAQNASEQREGGRGARTRRIEAQARPVDAYGRRRTAVGVMSGHMLAVPRHTERRGATQFGNDAAAHQPDFAPFRFGANGIRPVALASAHRWSARAGSGLDLAARRSPRQSSGLLRTKREPGTRRALRMRSRRNALARACHDPPRARTEWAPARSRPCGTTARWCLASAGRRTQSRAPHRAGTPLRRRGTPRRDGCAPPSTSPLRCNVPTTITGAQGEATARAPVRQSAPAITGPPPRQRKRHPAAAEERTASTRSTG